MPTRRQLVCLANSKKLSAFCVAGVDPESLEWVRPLGSGSHGAITTQEQTLDDGSRPELLDVIEVPLAEARPQPGQPENWRLASGAWRRIDQLNDSEARELLDKLAVDDPVFGTNERAISVESVANGLVDTSLAVVQAGDVTWTKRVWPEGAKIRAIFRHADAIQDLPVTDPSWLANFAHDASGAYPHSDDEDVYLILSLGEPMDGEHWKLVAGVICLQR
jgi:hypothetical protein